MNAGIAFVILLDSKHASPCHKCNSFDSIAFLGTMKSKYIFPFLHFPPSLSLLLGMVSSQESLNCGDTNSIRQDLWKKILAI